jgi:fructokinase
MQFIHDLLNRIFNFVDLGGEFPNEFNGMLQFQRFSEAWLELNSTAPLASAKTFSPRMGGSAVSLALAYAAQGGRASLLTQLGEDAFGHRIADALSAAGVDIRRVCFTSRAPTPLLFDGGGEQLGCRTRSSELLYAPEQLGADWAADAEMLAFSSACLVDSPCRYTHLAALDTARTAGVPVCFVPSLRPALWPGEKTLRDTVLQFLPFADILVLTADEMELLLDTREYQVGLFALLRGHTQLVVLETEEGVHAFTRAVHAFRPGLSAPPEELAARLLYQISQQELTLKKLMKCSAPALQTIL